MVNDFDWKRPHGMTTFLKFVLRVLTLSSGVECCMFRTNYSKGLGLPPKRTRLVGISVFINATKKANPQREPGTPPKPGTQNPNPKPRT